MSFNVKIRSRHKTHGAIRGRIEAPVRTIVRFGSSTTIKEVYPKLKPGSNVLEINPVDGIKNSASKLLMKRKFKEAGIKTAEWCEAKNVQDVKDFAKKYGYPVVAKSHYGSRGEGNFLLKTEEELTAWIKGKDFNKYIFEKYYDFVREYRLHTDSAGCFYTCRKMLKEDTPKDTRWFRNDSNSVWIMEENAKFDKPQNWKTIVAECVKALAAVGLDVAAFDVKVQSSKSNKEGVRANPDFIVIESNSAPSFGDVTTKKYLEQIPKIIKRKL